MEFEQIEQIEKMEQTEARRNSASPKELSLVIIPLLKGVIYQEENQMLWGLLLNLQARVRDYVKVLGVELILDETEGYAFLRSKASKAAGENGAENEQNVSSAIPRLIVRRQLSYPVSLLLALLRKKMAEFDTKENDARMIISKEEIIEMIRIFLPEGSNEAKFIDHIDAAINKTTELGFIRRLRGEDNLIEVRRIIKAFVDAQWLADFEGRLLEYRQHLAERTEENSTTGGGNE